MKLGLKIFMKVKKCLISNYSSKSKYYNDSNKLVVGKMKDQTVSVTIKKFAVLKPKMYSFLVDSNSEPKKSKAVNKNVVARISHSKYKDSLLSKKYLRI